ncbi:MAG: response regulator [Pseudomonadota bacterium]
MKVLILDDDADLAATLSDALRFAGHEVVLAATITTARRRMAETSGLDVAVLDVNLDEDNTIGLVRELRRSFPDLRIVSMTGGGRVGANIGMPLATAHGADAALLKPFTIDEFLEAVEPAG